MIGNISTNLNNSLSILAPGGQETEEADSSMT